MDAALMVGSLAILASTTSFAPQAWKIIKTRDTGAISSGMYAVTVVGFTTVRTMATVALTELDDESRLPENFWDMTTSLALAASTLAPRFGERPQDALCVGLLAQLGAALLHHDDREGYGELVAEHRDFTARRAAELRRYGLNSVRLTAVALEQWGFPPSMVTALCAVGEPGDEDGALLRAALEVAARLTVGDHVPVPVGELTGGQLHEDAVAPVLDRVRAEAEELRLAMLGE